MREPSESWADDSEGLSSYLQQDSFDQQAPAAQRLPHWRDVWLPTLLVVPVVVAVSIPFSLIGDGTAVRAASITWFLWLGLLAWRLLRIADGRTVRPAADLTPPLPG